MSKEIPFVAFGNNELGGPIAKGDLFQCDKCDGQHRIELGTNTETGKESDAIQFYKCGNNTYLAGIGGAAVPAPKLNK